VEAKKIRTAIKRSSSTATSNALRTQRRRSPTASSTSGSPPSENAMFSASQARRMGADSSWKGSNVLSPRSAPIVKAGAGVRRTTMSGSDAMREGSGGLRAAPVRMSTAAVPAVGRASLANAKNAWR
jgi:kinesin family protein 18/19